MAQSATKFAQSFFHGTKADLKPGDSIVVGCQSNFTEAGALSWVYFSATIDAAISRKNRLPGDRIAENGIRLTYAVA